MSVFFILVSYLRFCLTMSAELVKLVRPPCHNYCGRVPLTVKYSKPIRGPISAFPLLTTLHLETDGRRAKQTNI